MPSYSAFGARLRSAFDLPELVPTSTWSQRTWEIEVRSVAAPTIAGDALGIDTVYDGVHVRSFAVPGVLRLVFDDTGTFDVHGSERVIAWYPGPKANGAAMRADLLGRVMALATHADGGIALHASAVAIDDRAIAFLGPKHAGKSTLAMALVRRGARLLTDDTLAVMLNEDGQPRAAPGVQRARLWDDSARALGAASRRASGAKPTVDALPEGSLQLTDVPLDACYVMRNVGGHRGALASRIRLTSVQGALACVSFSKLGSLAGGAETAAVLDRATRVTRSTAFFAADIRRDLDRLADLADLIYGWHAPSGARAAACQ